MANPSTVIRAAGANWEIVTDDPALVSKLKKRGYLVDQEGNPMGFFHFSIPFAAIRFHKAKTIKTAAPIPVPAAKKAWGIRASFELNRW